MGTQDFGGSVTCIRLPFNVPMLEAMMPPNSTINACVERKCNPIAYNKKDPSTLIAESGGSYLVLLKLYVGNHTFFIINIQCNTC